MISLLNHQIYSYSSPTPSNPSAIHVTGTARRTKAVAAPLPQAFLGGGLPGRVDGRQVLAPNADSQVAAGPADHAARVGVDKNGRINNIYIYTYIYVYIYMYIYI